MLLLNDSRMLRSWTCYQRESWINALRGVGDG